MSKQDDLLPRKRASAPTPSAGDASSRSASAGASRRGLRVTRIVRLIGVLFGGGVTLVGMMSLVGLVIDSFWARLAIALVVVLGFPAFVSDRLLKRTSLRGGFAMVGDVFAIVLLVVANVLVAVQFASRPLFVREGDRYARSGSRTMARIVYFLGGLSPVFPDEKGVASTSSSSSSASSSGLVPSSDSASTAPDASGGR